MRPTHAYIASYDARGEYNCVFTILHINHQSRFIYKYDRMFFWQARTRNMSVYVYELCSDVASFTVWLTNKLKVYGYGNWTHELFRTQTTCTSSNISIWHCIIKNEESKWSKGLRGYLMESARTKGMIGCGQSYLLYVPNTPTTPELKVGRLIT